jgi:hypothetical protein
MGKVFKKKLHFWTVSQKQNVVKLTKQGLNPKKMRLQLFKGDKTVNDRSMAAMISRLKREPEFANVPGKYPGGKIPTALSLAERIKKNKKSSNRNTVVKPSRNKKRHTWSAEEKQILIDNLKLSAGTIKKKFFKSNREVSAYKIGRQLNNLRQAAKVGKLQPVAIKKTQSSPSPFSVRRASIVKSTVQLKIDFTGEAEILWNKFNMKTSVLKDELNTLQALIDESNFETSTKDSMKSAISKIATETFRKEQNTLAESLKV